MTAITTAARLLREAAAELKNAHTLGGDWGNEHEALDAYNEHMATATTLEHMARQCLQQIEEPAGAAPAAVAGPAWDKTRDSLATLLLGLVRRPFLDFDVACIALDAATEPGMPLAYMRHAPAAPALEAPAASNGEQLDGVVRQKLGALLNAFGEAQWQAGRGVPCPSIEDAFEAVISATVALLAAAPQDQTDAQCVAAWRQKMQDEREGDAVVAMAFDAGRRAAAAPQAPNCTRCSGSGEDPEGYLTRGLGPDDHTVDGPCRSCDGTGAAPQAPAAPVGDVISDGEFAEMAVAAGAQRVPGYSPATPPVFPSWGAWGRFCDSVRAAPAAPAVDAWLQPDDMAALQRVHETAEDDESYDIGKEAVARLCAFGCLQSHSFGRYSTTDFGDYLLDTWAGARTLPFTTAAERAAQAAAKGEHDAAD